MKSDIALNKAAIIRRCLGRVREEFADDSSRLDDFTIQDAIVLNLLRACEAAIDLAMHRVAEQSLGVPQSSRDAFELLAQEKVISGEASDSMKHMVGFRNVAVHSCQELQLPILESILKGHLGDFEAFLGELDL